MGFKAGGNENELKENEIEMESQAIFQNQVVKIFKGKYKELRKLVLQYRYAIKGK